MALMKCPECELQVSDKAISCPHCGYPLKDPDQLKGRGKARPKHRRLPNGFGSITELKGRNLRNPFWARVCVGKSAYGKPILKSLKPKAYFRTYNDAYAALFEYNKNPYDLDNDMTIYELYDKWTDVYLKNASDTYARTISSAWAYCSSVYDMRAKDLRARHIKGCMECGYRIETRGKRKGEKIYPSATTKTKIKSLFNIMLDYALEFEIVDRNYSRTFDVSDDIVKEASQSKRGHIPFTDSELKILWDHVNSVKFADWVIIQCYMGWRPQELATLRLDEVNLDKWYMQAGMKTDAGKQRIVPIHSKIRELVKALEIDRSVLFAENENDIPSCLSAMDLFLLPSRFEGLPYVLVEAQASALPCIVSGEVTKEADLTGLLCFVDGFAKEEWIKEIQGHRKGHAIENYPDIQKALREKGYDIRYNGKRLAEFYEKCLGVYRP